MLKYFTENESPPNCLELNKNENNFKILEIYY